jgi:hypothetical protein
MKNYYVLKVGIGNFTKTLEMKDIEITAKKSEIPKFHRNLTVY